MWSKSSQLLQRVAYLVDIAIGLYINVGKNIDLKYDNYMQLWSEMKRLYPSFTFEIIPTVLGATELVPSGLRKNGVKNIKYTMLKCQRMTLLGTMKIVKSVLKMKISEEYSLQD